jgi:hypothetical protein
MSNETNKITVADVLTGQVLERAFTEDEKAEYDSAVADAVLAADAGKAREHARASALAKLAALGLTEEEIAAL